jgi:TonB family protein
VAIPFLDCAGHRARVSFRHVSNRTGNRPALLAAGFALTLAATYGPAISAAEDPPAPADLSLPPASPVDAMPAPADAAEFKRLYEAGDYPAAVLQGRAILAEAERRKPVDAEELQVALMNLGLVQRLAGDYVDAEATYERVIDLLEKSGRLTNPRLARAYAGLALTYYAGRRYDLAAPSFEHAIALSRRTEGLFNEDQLPLLDKQADALTELDRTSDALQAHHYALRLVERRYGEKSLRYAAELVALGRWYTRVHAYDSARFTLRRAAELIEEIEGPDSLELIGPLTAAADNARRWLGDPKALAEVNDDERQFLYHEPATPSLPSLSPGMIQSEGLRSLERAVEIVDANPDAPPGRVAAVRVQLGDLNQIRLAPDRALPLYQQAWQVAAGVTEGGQPLRQLLFGAPLLLYYAAPDGWSRYAARPAEEAERRNVELEVTVNEKGRVSESRVVNDAGDPHLGERTQRAAESARYRPRFVDGQPVATTGVRFVQPFYVLREQSTDAHAADEPVPPAAPPPEDPASQSVKEPPPPQGGG